MYSTQSRRRRTICLLCGATSRRAGSLISLRKTKRPGLNRVTGRSVDQSSPENCSHTPYVLIRTGAIARRNGILVTLTRVRLGLQTHSLQRHSRLSLKGGPIDLTNLSDRVIKPALGKAGLKWYGWHACRKGLASNLKELGIDDLVIQRILRHGNVGTTRKSYVKVRNIKVEHANAPVGSSF
jgi:integrase